MQVHTDTHVQELVDAPIASRMQLGCQSWSKQVKTRCFCCGHADCFDRMRDGGARYHVVGVVLLTIVRDPRASFAEAQWAVSTYFLCFAPLLLPAGSIDDDFARQKVFLSGIGLFAVASLLCGAEHAGG
jgi:hypothetical protein